MRSFKSGTCFAARVGACLSVAFLVAFFLPGFASGEIISVLVQDPDASTGTLIDLHLNGYTLAEIRLAGGIQIGDKLFDHFSMTSMGTLAPGYDDVAVTPVRIGGDYGMRFNGGWSAAGGKIVDSTIRFHASILPAFIAQGYQFKDNALWITAFGNNTTSGLASVSENVYASNPMEPPAENLANKFVQYTSDLDKKLVDVQDFSRLVTEIWIVKDVVANGGAEAGGAAHISEFYQTFSQVPEPGTLVLLSIGGVGLAVFAWRKRRS